jgi:hypothetical protein
VGSSRPAGPDKGWPRYIDRSEFVNLRAVGPRLYVGAEGSPPKASWALVVDLYGAPLEEGRLDTRYRTTERLLHVPFLDGDAFPRGWLGAVVSAVSTARKHGMVLIHCQAGLSRSASAAYAVLRVLDGLPHADAYERIKTDEGTNTWPRVETLGSARRFVERRLG